MTQAKELYLDRADPFGPWSIPFWFDFEVRNMGFFLSGLRFSATAGHACGPLLAMLFSGLVLGCEKGQSSSPPGRGSPSKQPQENGTGSKETPGRETAGKAKGSPTGPKDNPNDEIYRGLPGAGALKGSPLQALHDPKSPKIQIPLEVFGKEGTEKSLVLMLNDQQVKHSRHLWLVTHNVRYPEKASVRWNDGKWSPLNNDTARMLGTSKIYGGVGGAYATLKMIVPIDQSELRAGANTLTFRFNKSNGHSAGYRIVNLNLLTEADERIIPDSAYAESSPETWAPPSSKPADIAAGYELWKNGQLVSHYLPGAVPIKARCASCHTETGFDLKYFGFSNESIVERSKFHGMSEAQGLQVASYIRSLPTKAVGRPWNPPYQPGPGTSKKPNSEWAAGAGIDSILENDWDTIKSLFPNGVSRDAIMEGDSNRVKRYSAHDTPMAFQLPDWNHWLPEIHPLDAFGDAWTAQSPDLKRFNTIRAQLTGKSPLEIKEWYANSDTNSGGTRDATGYFAFKDWPGNNRNGLNVLRDIPGVKVSPGDMRVTEPAAAQKVYSLALLRMVKIFELQEEFQLTGIGPDVRRTWWAGFDEKESLPRTWVGIERLIFDTSPFLLGIEFNVTGSSSGDNPFNYDYLSNSWYHLQLILNAGNRHGYAHNVVDYGYAHGFMAGFNRKTNFTQAGKDVIWALKGLDEADNGNLPGPMGWSFRRTGLGALGITSSTDDDIHPFWVTNATPETSAVLSVLEQVNAEKMASWLPEQYITRDGAPFNPSEDGGNWDSQQMLLSDNHSDEFEARSPAYNSWKFLKIAKAKRLLHPALINARLQQYHAFWPGLDSGNVARNPWLSEVVTSGTAPAAPTASVAGEVRRVRSEVPDLVRKTVTVKWTPSAGASSYNVKRSDSPTGPFLTVAFFRTSGTFTDEIPVPGRTYHYRVSANSKESESLDSTSTSIVIGP